MNKMLIDVGGKELVMAKTDFNDSTALHWLCEYSNDHDNIANIIKLLLQVADTEPNLTEKNSAGKTPLDIAEEAGHWSIG